jgi:hypothetical protein
VFATPGHFSTGLKFPYKLEILDSGRGIWKLHTRLKYCTINYSCKKFYRIEHRIRKTVKPLRGGSEKISGACTVKHFTVVIVAFS